MYSTFTLTLPLTTYVPIHLSHPLSQLMPSLSPDPATHSLLHSHLSSLMMPLLLSHFFLVNLLGSYSDYVTWSSYSPQLIPREIVPNVYDGGAVRGGDGGRGVVIVVVVVVGVA